MISKNNLLYVIGAKPLKGES